MYTICACIPAGKKKWFHSDNRVNEKKYKMPGNKLFLSKVRTVDTLHLKRANALVDKCRSTRQEESAKGLDGIVAGGPNLLRAVVATGGLKAIIGAMRSHSSVVEVQERGCRALSFIAQSSTRLGKAVVTARGLEAVVAAMKMHAGALEVQAQGCAALVGVACLDSAYSHIILEAGGLSAAFRIRCSRCVRTCSRGSASTRRPPPKSRPGSSR